MVRLMNIASLVVADQETKYRKGFDEFCANLQEQILTISLKLNTQYFSPTTYQQQGSKSGFQFEV
jgi:hypothetical protein